ncbi:hypothetical protein D3C78_1820600 [compost metagenome]
MIRMPPSGLKVRARARPTIMMVVRRKPEFGTPAPKENFLFQSPSSRASPLIFTPKARLPNIGKPFRSVEILSRFRLMALI